MDWSVTSHVCLVLYIIFFFCQSRGGSSTIVLILLLFLGSYHRLLTSHKETQLVFISCTKANWNTGSYFHLESKRRGRWWHMKEAGNKSRIQCSKKRVAYAGHELHISLEAELHFGHALHVWPKSPCLGISSIFGLKQILWHCLKQHSWFVNQRKYPASKNQWHCRIKKKFSVLLFEPISFPHKLSISTSTHYTTLFRFATCWFSLWILWPCS